MKLLLQYWILIFLFSLPARAQENLYSAGIHSGYSMFGKFNAIKINNAIPLTLSLGYNPSEHWTIKLTYQRIKTEHNGKQPAIFQAIRLTPEFEWYTIKNHNFKITTGLGYQHTKLSGIDTVGQIEWLVGPTWSFEIFPRWNFETGIYYVRSFDSFLKSSFHRLDISTGIAFHFGNISTSEQNKFSDSDTYTTDSDLDTIPDYLDFCPNTLKNDEIDNMGCPVHLIGRDVIEEVIFEPDSPRMTESSKKNLAVVAENLKKFPNVFFIIEGHSSSKKYSSKERLKISKTRAQAVMNVLVSYGIPEYKIHAVGLSDQYPLTDSSNESDQILNERIEIKWKTSDSVPSDHYRLKN